MRTEIKRMLVMGIVFSMFCGSIALSISKQASAKAQSKITKIVTLGKRNTKK